jgi:hypothetical protein
MSMIWTEKGCFRRSDYANEADLESSILKVQDSLLGPNRIYLDVKKKIGVKGGVRNIPDGYIIDLNGQKPRLYVVENELASHDPLRHVAIQILQFSLSFETEQRGIKSILFDAINNQSTSKNKCEEYASTHGYRNLDHLLEYLVFESPFAAVVIIDEIPDNLENIFVKRFQFGVEVIELARYENKAGEHFYRFTPFLADVTEDVKESVEDSQKTGRQIDLDEIDTVVVPAREDGFKETFLGENRWYQVRIHPSMRPQIKYIAVYQVSPISSITYIAPVKSIEPWKDTGKFVLNLAEPAKPIGPIKLKQKEDGGRVKALQNLRYTTRERLGKAKTLDEVW